MQVYLVGGAVRDKLLGRAVKDNDFVVVGSTVEQMLSKGFSQVGADFPVFLHPVSKQEYALARTERKSGQGYTGFAVHASPDVTIEEDLLRRDLTINAMAMEVKSLDDDSVKTGEVIDPYGGQTDLANKTLRHVSDAFSEDPLRVLRVARFHSRLASLGFEIAEETIRLMNQIATAGELNHLTAERIWQESMRATMQEGKLGNPQVYWQDLYQVGALASIMPNLHEAWKNKDIQTHICLALQQSTKLDLTMPQRWAILMASFATVSHLVSDSFSGSASDTGVDTGSRLSFTASSKNKNEYWLTKIDELHKGQSIPKAEQKLAKLYASLSDKLANIDSLSADELISLVTDSSAHKQSEQIEQLLTISAVLSMANKQQLVNKAITSYHAIGMQDIDPKLQGKAIGEALAQARVDNLKKELEKCGVKEV